MDDEYVVVDLAVDGQVDANGVFTMAITAPGVRINIESLWDEPSVSLLQSLIQDLESVVNDFFASAENDEGGQHDGQ